MIEKTESLYKLIILYMLKKVTFPLTNGQLAEFLIGYNYTTYFHLQEVLSDMRSSGLLTDETHMHVTYYEIAEKGEEMLRFFENEISPQTRQEITDFLKEHAFEMRSESTTIADYTRDGENNYQVICTAKEGKSTLLKLSISVPTETAAQTLAENWKKKSPEVYAAIMKILM